MTLNIPVKVLDGKNTIGGTKILLTKKDHGLLLDFGLNYTLYGRFFEEYMKPRLLVGLRDLWQLQMMPPYPALYRPELMPEKFPNSQDLPVKQVDGLILSHAHMDHVGLAGTLNINIPIISSATSLAILRAHQDSGRTQFYQDAAYCSQVKEGKCREHPIIKADGKAPNTGRAAIVMHGQSTKDLQDLWERPEKPDGSGKKVEGGTLDNLKDSSLDWKIDAFPVDHSIPGACATVIKLDEEVVAYTGDLRFCGSLAASTQEFVSQAKKMGTTILITEGTQVTRTNECTTSEKKCEENCGEAIADIKEKVVVADFSPKNIERLYGFLKIADETKRRLVILPKDVFLLDCLRKVEKTTPLPSEKLLVYDTPKGTEDTWEKWTYDTYSDHRVSASQISSAPSEYILAFSFLDMKFLNDINPKGGLYIFSSSEPYTEEQMMDFKRLHNWLSFYGFDIRGFKCKGPESDGNFELDVETGYHSSGHATKDELENMIKEIEPEILIPVHTTDQEWFVKKFGDKCEVL